jgi:protein involved in polysaccharide export with SLBB domain
MERQGDEIHITTDEVRGGSTPHIVRYVLGISLFLIIIAFSVVWMTGSMNTPQVATVSAAGSQVP